MKPQPIVTGHPQLDDLAAKAANTARRRINYNFHPADQDPLQRMLNAVEPGSYIQPHKHENPDKTEVFIILRGKLAVIVWDEAGLHPRAIVLTPGGENLAVEIPPRTWHMIASLETGTVVYEIKNGPWDPHTDKIFAPWAPIESDPEAVSYLNQILENLKLK